MSLEKIFMIIMAHRRATDMAYVFKNKLMIALDKK
jgi:hypothetical protein